MSGLFKVIELKFWLSEGGINSDADVVGLSFSEQCSAGVVRRHAAARARGGSVANFDGFERVSSY